MKKRDLSIVVVGLLALLLLTSCYKDGDGKLEMKEPRKEISDMPPGMVWDASDPDNVKRESK